MATPPPAPGAEENKDQENYVNLKVKSQVFLLWTTFL